MWPMAAVLGSAGHVHRHRIFMREHIPQGIYTEEVNVAPLDDVPLCGTKA